MFVEPYHLELINGQEVEKPLPKRLHVIVQSYLQFLFLSLLRERYLCASELNFWCGLDRLVPDLTIVRRGAEYRDGDLVEAPALVVKILSPGQTIGSLMDKASRLVMAGRREMLLGDLAGAEAGLDVHSRRQPDRRNGKPDRFL